MENKRFLRADDIAKYIGCSMATAYKLIRIMNKELAEKNYITIRGYVPAKYFMEHFYN